MFFIFFKIYILKYVCKAIFYYKNMFLLLCNMSIHNAQLIQFIRSGILHIKHYHGCGENCKCEGCPMVEVDCFCVAMCLSTGHKATQIQRNDRW